MGPAKGRTRWLANGAAGRQRAALRGDGFNLGPKRNLFSEKRICAARYSVLPLEY